MPQSPPDPAPPTPTTTSDASPTDDAPPEYRITPGLIVKSLLGLVALLGLAYLCGVVLAEPIEWLGREMMARFGLAGLFTGAMITDSSPLPMTNEPLVLLAIGAGRSANQVFAVVSVASWTAGLVGYSAGRIAGDSTPLGAWIRRRYPGFDHFMRRWGATGVAICAILPIPFALSTWSAGMTRVAMWKVALASLVRVPKTAFYVWLIAQGWTMGVS